MHRLPTLLVASLLIAGCQPAPHYEVRQENGLLVRTETRSGKVEILHPQHGWRPAETHMREWLQERGGAGR